jgi:hypothetical protein
MKIKCLLEHDYKRLSEPVPVKQDGAFSFNMYEGHYALGECKNCGHIAMVRYQVNGETYSFSNIDMKTKKEWLKELQLKVYGMEVVQ